MVGDGWEFELYPTLDTKGHRSSYWVARSLCQSGHFPIGATLLGAYTLHWLTQGDFSKLPQPTPNKEASKPDTFITEMYAARKRQLLEGLQPQETPLYNEVFDYVERVLLHGLTFSMAEYLERDNRPVAPSTESYVDHGMVAHGDASTLEQNEATRDVYTNQMLRRFKEAGLFNL